MLWRGFSKPKCLAVDTETDHRQVHGKFSAQPFERGFGTTIGNYLRRTPLSSIEGAAVTATSASKACCTNSSPSPELSKMLPTSSSTSKQIPLQAQRVTAPRPSTCALTRPASSYLRHDRGRRRRRDPRQGYIYICTVSEGGKIDMEMRPGARPWLHLGRHDLRRRPRPRIHPRRLRPLARPQAV